ncbi:unnamed protein product [Prorocentrum cordatum]|uniref:Uncharacterized protein n=1 Tax=Prorocentrum cordatum TaxID=2364126 RepID=A0ABN9QS56_9DINO|nr:unnamed protein product [Polarella glacialis]|mmetsp:Transcript_124559/g.338336  ORF Transcript_124559/g.338336 Transcript_124559/m.338336 type:complete len:248 (+) Transcript_124559:85-828(+)
MAVTFGVTILGLAIGGSVASRLVSDTRSDSKVGPCSESWNHLAPKFASFPGIFDKLEEEEEFSELRYDFEPKEECHFGASVGVHAFIAVQLNDALHEASGHVAVADIGSGTGFLLALFKSYVKVGIDVVGVETDPKALAEARALQAVGVLPDECKLLDENGLTFTYEKKFAVINVGFASTELPEHFKELTADDATILMPICNKPFKPLSGGQSCAARYTLFKKVRGSWQTAQEVGPDVSFFFVENNA